MTLEILLAEGEAIRAKTADRSPGIARLEMAGVGWATVDHERAIGADLGTLLGGPWLPATRDELLGASAWRLPGANPVVVLLEPDTEGPLAASLARYGEGVVAVYLRADAVDPGTAPAPGLGRPGDGPLGRGRLVGGGPLWGPNVIVLDRATSAPGAGRPRSVSARPPWGLG